MIKPDNLSLVDGKKGDDVEDWTLIGIERPLRNDPADIKKGLGTEK